MYLCIWRWHIPFRLCLCFHRLFRLVMMRFVCLTYRRSWDTRVLYICLKVSVMIYIVLHTQSQIYKKKTLSSLPFTILEREGEKTINSFASSLFKKTWNLVPLFCIYLVECFSQFFFGFRYICEHYERAALANAPKIDVTLKSWKWKQNRKRSRIDSIYKIPCFFLLFLSFSLTCLNANVVMVFFLNIWNDLNLVYNQYHGAGRNLKQFRRHDRRLSV